MGFTFRSKATESPGYRADIDGLRALAVLSVVFYHAGLTGFSGGFVGVDIFFVISGYLITGVIENDIQRGRFSFRSFYERRMRRIFPALFTVVLVCTGLAVFLFPPAQFKDYGWSLLAMTGFVSNIYFKSVSHAAGYFAEASGVQLLLHTWSLSVEEQFYVFFPIILLVLTRWLKAYRTYIIGLLILISFAMSYWGVRHSPTGAFYLLPGRAWELLIGSLLALRPLPDLKSPVSRGVAGLAGIGLVAYSVIFFTATTSFPGPNALFPCVGAWLIIYSGGGGESMARSLLGFRPLVFVGVISYSLYLWHWPLLALTRYYYAAPWISTAHKVAPLVLSFVLAFLSFEWIETPFRRRRAGTTARTLWIGVGASAALASLAAVIVYTDNIPTAFNAHTSRIVTENYGRKAEFSLFPEKCNNYGGKISVYSEANFCEMGHSTHNILFWGDSHTAQLFPVVDDLRERGDLSGEGIVFAVAAGCPPSVLLNRTDPTFYCDSFTRFAMTRAAMSDIDTVFIEFSPWWEAFDDRVCVARDGHCVQTLTGHEAGLRVVAELEEHIRALRASGKRVIVGLPFPVYDKMIPDYEIRVAAMGRLGTLGGYPGDISPAALRDDLKARAIRAGAEIYDPRDTLCSSGSCVLQEGGVSLYEDNSHLAPGKVGLLRDGLSKALKRPGV